MSEPVIISGLCSAIAALFGLTTYYSKKDREGAEVSRKQEREMLLEQIKGMKEESKQEKEMLLNEIRQLKEEGKENQNKWLSALQDNTGQLKNVADKLEVIPTLTKRVDVMENNIEKIIKKLEV